MKEESKITASVREAIIRAADKGENLSKKIMEVTRDALNDGLKKAGPQKEKAEQALGAALKRFTASMKATKERIEAFKKQVKHSKKKSSKTGSIRLDAIQATAEKSLLKILEIGEQIGEITTDAAQGVYLGVKDVVGKKKPARSEKPHKAEWKTAAPSAKKSVKKAVKKSPAQKKTTEFPG